MRESKQRQIVTINEAPGAVQKGYLASWLVVCTLPHRDPKERDYVRTNGDCTLTIQSGMEKGQPVGLPYGALSRLLLFWLISEANRTKSRRLFLGDTIDGFLRAVGLDPKTGGGKRGDMKRVREQMHRLFRCRISFERDHAGKGISWLDMNVAPKGELWWDVKNPEQAALFESWIELGEELYAAATTSPVPIDFRALCALKHSPMAIDLYAWLTWRVHGMKDGGSAEIPLHGPKGLAEQIGSNYGQPQHFKAALAEGLEAVKLVWPKLDCEITATRLTVRKSPVPIPDVPINKKRRAFGQVKDNVLLIDTEADFKRENPRIRLTTVKKAFFAFLEREQIKPTDIDALFRDYAAKWVKGEL